MVGPLVGVFGGLRSNIGARLGHSQILNNVVVLFMVS